MGCSGDVLLKMGSWRLASGTKFKFAFCFLLLLLFWRVFVGVKHSSVLI